MARETLLHGKHAPVVIQGDIRLCDFLKMRRRECRACAEMRTTSAPPPGGRSHRTPETLIHSLPLYRSEAMYQSPRRSGRAARDGCEARIAGTKDH